MTKDGFIVLRISDSGIEERKVYHTSKRRGTGRIFSLYEEILPDLIRLDAKIRKQGHADTKAGAEKKEAKNDRPDSPVAI